MPQFTSNVNFEHVAREWRCKFSKDNEMASLAAIQAVTDGVIANIKAVDGVTGVQRIVCGGCLDYKLIITLTADKFPNIEASGLEAPFLEAIGKIEGVTSVETQSFTIAPM